MFPSQPLNDGFIFDLKLKDQELRTILRKINNKQTKTKDQVLHTVTPGNLLNFFKKKNLLIGRIQLLYLRLKRDLISLNNKI